ncbi:putative endoglucanase [Crateriforma conspicua]|uniref:Putative endoglucanase n=1 Tax=Crateriforma conspicua TaxID=2527996 RepID=A0A5C6FYY5_9PLAN|nr:DUF4038 domain-containing protein [Crateriforma conspicua]TWU67544.1 putative endoglucanase [Crateriforma conspicua]
MNKVLRFGLTLTSVSLVCVCASVVADAQSVISAAKDAPQWMECEIEFRGQRHYDNAYVDSTAWVDFVHDDGTKIRRPIFWDGGQTFRVRFASTKPSGTWKWTSSSDPADDGLHGLSGELTACPTGVAETIFQRHGFWSIPPGERNLVHSDGKSCFLCADTAWALPWRATVDQAVRYADDRAEKGFNAALLMTVMPDSNTTGPRSRTEDKGFAVGFEDLPKGRLRELNAEYFQYFDSLVDALVQRGVAPVYQPVFHGYGWKGGGTAGNKVSADDYARYCRYLVARYGARPAIWLIGGDGPAVNPTVVEQLDQSGQEIERWDAYRQPTGIHYSPHAWNRTHQDKTWLDFQWCQTGHNGEHVPERVADMWRNQPVKAVANGEPTYENIGETGKGAGWWQGHEAICNVTAGGTMGVVYGAASLWNWVLHPNEPGHEVWCTAPGAGWEEALGFEGSRYPGVLAKIMNQYPIRGMQPDWTCTYGRRGLLIPNKLFVLYLPTGGRTAIVSTEVPSPYRIYDLKTGQVVGQGRLPDDRRRSIDAGVTDQPRLVVFHSEG